MSREVELSTYDRGSMLYTKEQLLVPETLLKRRLEFLRGEYDRQHAPRGSAALMEDHGSAGAAPAARDAARARCWRRTRGSATRPPWSSAARSSTCCACCATTASSTFDMLTDLCAVDLSAAPRRASRSSTTSTRSRGTTACASRCASAEDDAQVDERGAALRVGQLDGARGLGPLRHPLRRPSRSAAHPALRRVRGASAAQGLPEGAAPAAGGPEELAHGRAVLPDRAAALRRRLRARPPHASTRCSTWGRRIRPRTAP